MDSHTGTLKGKIIITTQPADQAKPWMELLEKEGAIAYNLPMIETRTTRIPDQLMQQTILPGAFDLLVFTSKKGIDGFFRNLLDIDADYTLPTHVETAVVGSATASHLHTWGYNANHINPGTNAADLASFLQNKVLKGIEKRVLLALGNKAPDFLQKELASFAKVIRTDVYETICLEPGNKEISGIISNRRADMVLFTSPSGFYAFKDAFNELKGLNLAAIGSTTADAIKQKGYPVAVQAALPEAASMVKALKDFFTN